MMVFVWTAANTWCVMVRVFEVLPSKMAVPSDPTTLSMKPLMGCCQSGCSRWNLGVLNPWSLHLSWILNLEISWCANKGGWFDISDEKKIIMDIPRRNAMLRIDGGQQTLSSREIGSGAQLGAMDTSSLVTIYTRNWPKLCVYIY